jgi:hypothetical protein
MIEKLRCEPLLARGRSHNPEEDDVWGGETHADNWTEDMQTLTSEMAVLLNKSTDAARLGLLEQRGKGLEDHQIRHESLTSLAPSTLKLTKPIPISIAFNGDDYVATFFDANISATGDTPQEAVWNIQDIIVLKFNRLGTLPAKALGPIPKRQLAVLREFIAGT